MKTTLYTAKAQTRQSGMTLVELLVALAIGSFLMVGAVQVYNQSRQAFVINESIARVQETAQFAMDTIESDLRMASNYGLQSRGLAIDGRSNAIQRSEQLSAIFESVQGHARVEAEVASSVSINL